MLALTIAIPTYNEVGNIERLLTELARVADRHPGIDLTALVVDDSSPDGTASVVMGMADALRRSNFTVVVLGRHTKDGLGAAYVHAFEWVLAQPTRPDYVMQMDADGSHDPRYLDEFIREMHRGTELVVSTRYVRGGSTPDWAWHRIALSRGGNAIARHLLGLGITDYTGGFNMYSIALLERLDVATIESSSYGFQILLKYRAVRLAGSVAQIPIEFHDRTHGTSKMPTDTALQSLRLVLEIRFLGRHL